MSTPVEPLSSSILSIMYFGDVVFAVSGALTAARFRMDIIGFVLIGTITGIGGGTTRDLLLGRTVWWTQDPTELLLCISASLVTYFFIARQASQRKRLVWADALGLSVFSVVGCHIALAHGAPTTIAVFMGVITATGGGLIRDVITNTQPMVVSGQIYATAALSGSLIYAVLRQLQAPDIAAELLACLAAFSLRAAAIAYNIRMGPPGSFIHFDRDRH